MNQGNLSRRGFLARSLGGLMAAGLPMWYAKEIVADAQETKTGAQQNVGPNDRIVMAAIGTGTNRTRRGDRPVHGERGYQIMLDAMNQRNAQSQPAVQIVAVCDVDRPNAEFAAAEVNRRNGNMDCRVYGDYRELLRNNDIQAVTIGTPDHWHAQIAIAAMLAGKDVYCEKPLTLTIDEGKAMVRVARERNRVLQTGSQQRSDNRFRLACELVRNNRIGRVRKVTTLIGGNPTGGPFMPTPPPEGLNYDFWLGQTPQVEYNPERVFYNFRWYYEYSGGKMTDWGAHHNDIAQWGLGMDNSGPVTVRGTGQASDNRPHCFNCHPTFEMTYTYGNGSNGAAGTELVCRDGPPQNFPAHNAQGNPENNGILFEGENNQWIFVNRGLIMASDGNSRDSRLITEPLPQNATRLPVSQNHMGNFIQCFRSRQQPICNPVIGHRSVTVCHLGNIAVRFFPGQTLHWDPQEERFTGERAQQANTHLSRPRRQGYELGA
jgi:predicted dehydrogenase